MLTNAPVAELVTRANRYRLLSEDLSAAEWAALAAYYAAPVLPNIDAQILAALAAGGELNMSNWHTCATTHCRAGWAIHLAGQDGYALAHRLADSELAGQLIYVASGYDRPPDFFASNEDALREIRAAAARTGAP